MAPTPTKLRDLILPYSFLLRLLQVTLAITIAGLYGVDLAHFTANHASAPASWIYAEVVATLSTLTAGLYIFGKLKHVLWTLWDFIICVLWAAQAGYFGTLFLGDKRLGEEEFVGEDDDDGRMRAGVWVGLVCMAMWLVSCVWGVAGFVKGRKREGKGATEMVGESGVHRPMMAERGRMETMLPTCEDVVMGGRVEEEEKGEKGQWKVDS